MISFLKLSALVVTALVAYSWWTFQLPPGPQPTSQNFRINDVTLINPAHNRVAAVNLSVANGRVSLHDPAQDHGVDTALEQYAGSYVMPGLVDMHTHLPPHTPLGLTEYFGLLYLLHGVTTLRVAGDTSGTEVSAASRVWTANDRPGPAMVSCGAFVSGGNPRWANSVLLRDPLQAPAVVEQLIADGARCIKSYDDLSLASVQALAVAASERDLPVIGHVPFGMRMEQARIPDVQHLMGVTPPEDIERGDHVMYRIIDWRAVDQQRMQEVVHASQDFAIAHTPTLVSTHQLKHYANYQAALSDPAINLLPRIYPALVWHPQQGIPYIRGFTQADHATIADADKKKLKLVGMLFDNGVKLHLGTDTQQPFVVPGHSLLTEIALFRQAGIPLEQVLAMATWQTSTGLGSSEPRLLQHGSPASFVIYRDDPTAHVNALNSLMAVVINGKLYSRESLEKAKNRYLAHFSHPLVDWVSMFVARRTLDQTVTRDH